MEKETNSNLFDWLYGTFIQPAETDLQKMEQFVDEVNSLLEENSSDNRLKISSHDWCDLVASILVRGTKTISLDLIIKFANFLFNLSEDAWIIAREEGELDHMVRKFNTYAEEIGSKIRLVPYIQEYRAILNSPTKLE